MTDTIPDPQEIQFCKSPKASVETRQGVVRQVQIFQEVKTVERRRLHETDVVVRQVEESHPL